MIRILGGTYKKKDWEILETLFSSLCEEFAYLHCRGYRECTDCPHYNLCTDLQKTRAHLLKKANEEDKT